MGHILCLIFLKTLSIYLLTSMVILIVQGSDLYLSPSPQGGELILQVGSSLTLECSYSSSDIITKDLVFTRNGVQLDSEFKLSHSGRVDGLGKNLTVNKNNVTCSDGGTYYCVIDTMSKKINVTIVKVTTRDYIVFDVSKSATLGCHPEICSPSNAISSSDAYQFRVTWMFKGHEVTSYDKMNPESGELVISSPDADNYGIYTCKFDVQRGESQLSKTLHSTKVYLKGPPWLRKVDSEKSVCLSDHVTLICEAAGFPPPILEWRKNSSDVETNSSRIYVLSGGLYIQSFTAHDIGEYTCIAKSEEFSETDRANIPVYLKDASDCGGDSKNLPVVEIAVGVACGVALVIFIVIAIIWIKKRRGTRQENVDAEGYASINFKTKKHKKKKKYADEALYDVVDVTCKKFEKDFDDGIS